jgi:hypothetical protein
LIKKWIRGRADQPDFWGYDQMRHLDDIVGWINRYSSREETVMDDRIRVEAEIVHKILSGWNDHEIVVSASSPAKVIKQKMSRQLNESMQSKLSFLSATKIRQRANFYFPSGDPNSPLMSAILSDFLYRSRSVTISSDSGYFLSSHSEVDRTIGALKGSVGAETSRNRLPIVVVSSTSYEESYLQEWLLYHLIIANVDYIVLLLSKPTDDLSYAMIKPFLHFDRVSVINMTTEEIGNQTCFQVLDKVLTTSQSKSISDRYLIHLSISEFLLPNMTVLDNPPKPGLLQLRVPVIHFGHNMRVAMHPGEIVTQDFTYRTASALKYLSHRYIYTNPFPKLELDDTANVRKAVDLPMRIFRYHKSAEHLLKRWVLAHWEHDELVNRNIDTSTSCLFREHRAYFNKPGDFVEAIMNYADSHSVDESLQEVGAKLRAAIVQAQRSNNL